VDARGLHIVHAGADRVVFKRGVRELLVNGEHTDTLVSQVLPLLDGLSTQAEVVEAFPAPWRPAVESLLDALVERGLVADGDAEADGGAGLGTLQDAFYANFPAAEAVVGELLRACDIVVVGLNLTSRVLVGALLDAGVGRIVLVPHAALDDGAPGLALEASGWPALDGGPGERVELAPQDDLAAVVAAGTLTVAGSDHGESEALLDVNRLALAAGRPFLPFWIADLVGHVGPLVYPFETACLRCYQLRVDSNDDKRDVSREVRRAVAEATDGSLSAGMLPPMASVVGGVVALEVLKVLTQFAPSDAVARAVEINLVAMSSAVRRVLKVPRCPDCSEIMDAAAVSVRAGPQATSAGTWVG